jgi:serine/threonine protein kinase
MVVEGQLKLIDFGLAKAIGNDTTNIMSEELVGSLNYISPEAILEADNTSDDSGNGHKVLTVFPIDISPVSSFPRLHCLCLFLLHHLLPPLPAQPPRPFYYFIFFSNILSSCSLKIYLNLITARSTRRCLVVGVHFISNGVWQTTISRCPGFEKNPCY